MENTMRAVLTVRIWLSLDARFTGDAAIVGGQRARMMRAIERMDLATLRRRAVGL